MALITTTLNPLATPLPFIAPAPAIDLWNTPIPRGEIVFIESAAAITIAGVGDDQRLTINCNLPVGFGYVMAETNMMLTSSDAAQWEAVCGFRLRDENGGNHRWTIHRRFEASATVITIGGSGKNRIYELVQNDPPRKMVICNLAAPGQLTVNVRNLTTNQAAGTLDFFTRFYQYDLNQAFRYAVNTPTLVR